MLMDMVMKAFGVQAREHAPGVAHPARGLHGRRGVAIRVGGGQPILALVPDNGINICLLHDIRDAFFSPALSASRVLMQEEAASIDLHLIEPANKL